MGYLGNDLLRWKSNRDDELGNQKNPDLLKSPPEREIELNQGFRMLTLNCGCWLQGMRAATTLP
jgi:hypothetical protein